MSDEQGVTSAVQDYYDGWFGGDAGRMERALHPKLAKRAPLGDGDRDEDTPRGLIEMTAEGPREYLHLVRMHEGWKIVTALYDLER